MSRRHDWFLDSFGQPFSWSRSIADLGNPIADVRDKLIDEAWFGRRSAEPSREHDLGWLLDDQREAPGSPQSSSQEPDRAQSQEPDRGYDLDR